MSAEIAIAFAFGPGWLGRQAQYLARSIADNTSISEVFAYTTPSEYERIDDRVLERISDCCDVGVTDEGISEYSISHKQAALKSASERSTADYLLCLDSDTVVLDSVGVPDPTADLMVKPVDIGGQYYASSDSFNEWESLASGLGFEFPGSVSRSTVDQKCIPPYWNSGVVLTRNNDLPSRWLSLTKTLWKEFDTGYFTDQVALGLLSTDYHSQTLDETYNYPLTHRLYVPSDVKVLHYNDIKHLGRVYSPKVLRRLYRTGLFSDTEFTIATLPQLIEEASKTVYRRLNFARSFP